MKLIEIYNRAIDFGRSLDPRKAKNNKISSYADTAVLYGDPDTQIKKILVGIDIEVGELLLADRLRKDQGLDLVIAHHPEGRAWAGFFEVMQLQVDLLKRAGLSKRVAQKYLDERMSEVERKNLANNHMRSVDAARLLDIPFMCVHTPADNHAANYIERILDKNKPKHVQDIISILIRVPEYKDAQGELSGPKIVLGSPRRPAGEIFVEMTGGTEGHKDVFEQLYEFGIRTIVGMHLSEEHFKKVKDVKLNAVIAGHISSDTLGLNLLLDKIEKEEKFEIISCSGFRRIRRDS